MKYNELNVAQKVQRLWNHFRDYQFAVHYARSIGDTEVELELIRIWNSKVK